MRWLGLLPLVFAASASGAPRQSNPAFLGIGFGQGPGGCTIESVTPNGPAADAGIRTDDNILAFDEVPLDPKRPCDQLVAAITLHVPGDRVRIDFMRGPVLRAPASWLVGKLCGRGPCARVPGRIHGKDRGEAEGHEIAFEPAGGASGSAVVCRWSQVGLVARSP